MTPERLAKIRATLVALSRAEAITSPGWQSPSTQAGLDLLAEVDRLRALAKNRCHMCDVDGRCAVHARVGP